MTTYLSASVLVLTVVAVMTLFAAGVTVQTFKATRKAYLMVLSILYQAIVVVASTLAYMSAFGYDPVDNLGVLLAFAVGATLVTIAGFAFLLQSSPWISIVGWGIAFSCLIFLLVAPTALATWTVIGNYGGRVLAEKRQEYVPIGPVSMFFYPERINAIEEASKEADADVVYYIRFRDESGEIDWLAVLPLEVEIWVELDRAGEFLEALSRQAEGLKVPHRNPIPFYHYKSQSA